MSSPSSPSWKPLWDQYEKSKANVFGSDVSGFTMVVDAPSMEMHRVEFISFSLQNGRRENRQRGGAESRG